MITFIFFCIVFSIIIVSLMFPNEIFSAETLIVINTLSKGIIEMMQRIKCFFGTHHPCELYDYGISKTTYECMTCGKKITVSQDDYYDHWGGTRVK